MLHTSARACEAPGQAGAGIRPRLVALVWLVLVLIEARPAYAYLDPGTGSALVCVLMSVVAAATFMLRTFVYAVRGRLRTKRHADAAGASASGPVNDKGIVLFSEGRDYWLTFKPVIDALLARGQPFRYLSMDVEDPALAIDDPNMDSRYIGRGAIAFGRVSAARGSVMLATTPNIGCPDFPIPKPSNIDCLVHVMHGCCDISYYRRHSLDYYDAVFILSKAMEKSVRRLETLRGLPAKECVVAGTPNMDGLAASVAVAKRTKPNDKPIIVLAPTWGLKGFLRRLGADFIEALAATGEYRLVLRPHPQSWKKEPRFMDEVVRALSRHQCVTVDKSLSPAETMRAADLLISDISGIRFEFAFLYERPVITLKGAGAEDAQFEAADLDCSWEDEAERRIGAVVEPSAVADMPAIVKNALALSTAALADVRDTYIAHLGRSGEVIADWLVAKQAAEEATRPC